MRIEEADGTKWCEHCDAVIPKKGEGIKIIASAQIISGKRASEKRIRDVYNEWIAAVEIVLCNNCKQHLFK